MLHPAPNIPAPQGFRGLPGRVGIFSQASPCSKYFMAFAHRQHSPVESLATSNVTAAHCCFRTIRPVTVYDIIIKEGGSPASLGAIRSPDRVWGSLNVVHTFWQGSES